MASADSRPPIPTPRDVGSTKLDNKSFSSMTTMIGVDIMLPAKDSKREIAEAYTVR